MKACQNRSQALYQALSNSGDVEEKFEKIIKKCKKKNIKYEDPDFYPQKSLNELDKKQLGEHEWRRIEDQYPNLYDNISPKSIIQGRLGDCYFIVSLIYASHYKKLVKSLFHPKSSLKYGCVLVYFHFLGEKIPVIIDTQVAYRNKLSENPIFSHPRTNNDSCWFVLVEKAFAKACGSYSSIESGSTSFAIHVLFDYYSTSFNKIIDIIPAKSLEDENKRNQNQNTNEVVFNILSNLKNKNAMIGTSICKDVDENIGLISNHAYYILDLRKSDDKMFIKLRNPWGTGKYKGNYSIGSKKWTEKLKNDLDYQEDDDGSFWMLLENYFYYFTDISYSLPNLNNWKETSVCGIIDGYLDGRSPCTNYPNIGCIPQWSIKFTKKTIVRLTYDVSGPESFHGIYICKNHGRKVELLDVKTEIMRSNTNSFVNGIEYIVDDFSEPYTFFLTRCHLEKDPCYFRILIQSPDENYVINKFNDNYVLEKWNCASDSGIFSFSIIDEWDPFNDKPLTTCRQWYVNFPDLKENEETELRIRIFKNTSRTSMHFIIVRTDERISYIFKGLNYESKEIYSESRYEEFSIPISNKFLNNDGNNKPFNYVFSIYQKEIKDRVRFKFEILSKRKFKFNVMPEPDPMNYCGYTINSCLSHGKYDGLKPFGNTVENLRQWCLIFKKSPTNLFVEYFSNESLTNHFIYLEMKEKPGDKISTFYKGTTKFDFQIYKNCIHDQIIWKIEDISKPYAFCITRNPPIQEQSAFILNIFGSEDFDMFEIKGNQVGNKVHSFINQKYYYYTKDREIENFPEIKFIEQPNNFAPIKSHQEPKINKSTNHIQKYDEYYSDNSIYSDISDRKNKKDIKKDNVFDKSNQNDDDYANLDSSIMPNDLSKSINVNNIKNGNNKDSKNNSSGEIQNAEHKKSSSYSNIESNDTDNIENNNAKNDIKHNNDFNEIENQEKNSSDNNNIDKNNSEKSNEEIKCHSNDEEINCHSNREKINCHSNDEEINCHSNDEEVKCHSNHEKINCHSNDEEINCHSNDEEINYHSNDKKGINSNQIIGQQKDKMLDIAKSYLKKHRIVFTEVALIWNFENNSVKNYIFVLSLFCIIILKQKRNSRKLAKKVEQSFIDISSISLLNNEVIKIKFKKSPKIKRPALFFQTENPQLVINSLNNHIQRVLSSKEIRLIKYEKISMPKSLMICTSHSILYRFNSLISLNKIEIPIDLKNKLFQILFSHSNKINLSKIKKIKKLFPLLSSCLLMNKFVNQICIMDAEYIIPLMIQNIEYFDNISHIEIKDSISDNLHSLIEQSKSINSLSFLNVKFKKYHFDYISNLIENDSIDSISFDQTLNDKSFSSFIQIPYFSKLKYFRASNINNINFSSSIQFFRNISILSLKSCNLKVGDVLNYISSDQLNSLKELDLSGNIGTGFESDQISFPNQLLSIYVNDIKWEIGNLISFFNLLCCSNLTTLSINNIKFLNPNKQDTKYKKSNRVQNIFDDYDFNCWKSLFDNIPFKMNSINHLNWNSNRINSKFITFLMNSKQLINVSFCGCHSNDLIFIKSLLLTRQILSINLQNIFYTDTYSYFNNFKEFLSNIYLMKTLKQIDLSHNNFSNECLDILSESLITSTTIESIAFDDSNIKSFNDLSMFYIKLMKLKEKPIYISYPILDILRLKLDQNVIDNLNKWFNQLKKPLCDRKELNFSILSEVYFLNLNKEFPQFMPKMSSRNTEKSMVQNFNPNTQYYDSESIIPNSDESYSDTDSESK